MCNKCNTFFTCDKRLRARLGARASATHKFQVLKFATSCLAAPSLCRRLNDHENMMQHSPRYCYDRILFSATLHPFPHTSLKPLTTHHTPLSTLSSLLSTFTLCSPLFTSHSTLPLRMKYCFRCEKS